MYQVLYRKWRPKSFADVVGQEHVTKTLENEIKLNRIGHAYLFVGSRGTGKTTCAKIFAKAINCHVDSQRPCNKCEICESIDSGSSIDVVEMDAASNNSVNDIRSICEEAIFTPVMTKYRVYIIDEAHMLSQGAFNALLKTLEEPPKHVVFILATTEAHKIPATILSRCQRFEFNKISLNSLCARIEFVAQSEKIKISHEASYLIAKLSDGALRDALSMLDKCMNVSNNITVDIVSDVAGVIGNDYLFKVLEFIIEPNISNVLKIIDDLSTKSKDLMRFCEEIICHFRDLMLVMTMNDPQEIISASPSDIEHFKRISQNISLEKVISIIDILESAVQKMSYGCNKRIETETTFIKVCTIVKDPGNESLIKRIEKLESGNYVMKKVQNANNSTPNVDRANELQHEVQKSNVSLDKLTENAKPFVKWPEVLKLLKNYSQTMSAAFSESTAYTSDNYMLIDVKNEMAFELLRKSSQRDKMRLVIKEVTGKLYKLGPYKKESKEKKGDDPLDEFTQNILNEGINVTID